MFANGNVGVELTFNTGHRRERGNGGKFTGLPVQIVPAENVAEKMGFQILIDRRSKVK